MSHKMITFTAIGGAHVDRRGKTDSHPVMGASNPGRFTQDLGGAALNSARTLAALGGQVSFLRPSSRDHLSDFVGNALIEDGLKDICVSTDPEFPTPTYTAVLDNSGELIISLADMSLYEAVSPADLEKAGAAAQLRNSDAALIDANLSAKTLGHVAALCQQSKKPLFAIGTSPSKVTRYASFAPAISLLFLNRREAEALLSEPERSAGPEDLLWGLHNLGFNAVVLTDGPNPALASGKEGIFRLMPPKPDKPADVTGAGDALAAAVMLAMVKGHPLPEALRHGIAASQIALASNRSVGQNFTGSAFDAVLAKIPEAEPLSQP